MRHVEKLNLDHYDNVQSLRNFGQLLTKIFLTWVYLARACVNSPLLPLLRHWGRVSSCPPLHTPLAPTLQSAPNHLPSPQSSAQNTNTSVKSIIPNCGIFLKLMHTEWQIKEKRETVTLTD